MSDRGRMLLLIAGALLIGVGLLKSHTLLFFVGLLIVVTIAGSSAIKI